MDVFTRPEKSIPYILSFKYTESSPIFLLILPLLLISTLSIADSEQAPAPLDASTFLNTIETSSLLNQKAKRNTQNIEKNALEINKVKSHYNTINKTSFDLNKQTTFNKSNVNNLEPLAKLQISQPYIYEQFSFVFFKKECPLFLSLSVLGILFSVFSQI